MVEHNPHCNFVKIYLIKVSLFHINDLYEKLLYHNDWLICSRGNLLEAFLKELAIPTITLNSLYITHTGSTDIRLQLWAISSASNAAQLVNGGTNFFFGGGIEGERFIYISEGAKIQKYAKICWFLPFFLFGGSEGRASNKGSKCHPYPLWCHHWSQSIQCTLTTDGF